jgi:hypothetical protein
MGYQKGRDPIVESDEQDASSVLQEKTITKVRQRFHFPRVVTASNRGNETAWLTWWLHLSILMYRQVAQNRRRAIECSAFIHCVASVHGITWPQGKVWTSVIDKPELYFPRTCYCPYDMLTCWTAYPTSFPSHSSKKDSKSSITTWTEDISIITWQHEMVLSFAMRTDYLVAAERWWLKVRHRTPLDNSEYIFSRAP